MKKQRGLTIIQVMLIVLIAGVVGSIVVRLIIDKRCEANPSTLLCEQRK